VKRILVAVRDSAMAAFMNPFVVQATGQAVRSFTDEVNRAAQDNALNQHPEDFELYQVGFFDDDTGEFSNELARLVRGKDVVKS
jgi:hypothetical protein